MVRTSYRELVVLLIAALFFGGSLLPSMCQDTPGTRDEIPGTGGGNTYDSPDRIFIRDSSGDERTSFDLDENITIVVKQAQNIDLEIRIHDVEDNDMHQSGMIRSGYYPDGTYRYKLTVNPSTFDTPITTPDWYYIVIQRPIVFQDDFYYKEALLLGDLSQSPEVHPVRMFNDTSHHNETHSFNPGDTVHVTCNRTSTGNFPSREDIYIRTYDFDDLLHQSATLSVEGMYINFSFQLPGNIPRDSWYTLNLRFRTAGWGGDPIQYGGRQFYIMPAGAEMQVDTLKVDIPTEFPPDYVLLGQKNVTMAELQMSTETGNVNLKTVTMQMLGTAAMTDITSMELYLDDGDGILDETSDFSFGEGTIDSGFLVFTDIEMEISSGTPRTFFVSFDISPNATVGANLGLGVISKDRFEVNEPDLVNLLSITSRTTTILSQEPDVLNLEGSDLAPATVTQGDQDVSVLSLTFNTTDDEVNVTSLTVDRTGTAQDEDTGDVTLLVDDGNGQPDLRADVPVTGPGSFVSGSCTISGFTIPVLPGSNVTVFIMVDFTVDGSGGIFGVSIPDGSYIGVGPDDLVGTFDPISTIEFDIQTRSIITMNVSLNDQAPQYVGQGDIDVFFAKVTVDVDRDEIPLSFIRFRMLGTAADTDISEVTVYTDNNGDGVPGTGDAQLGVGSFSSSIAQVPLPPLVVNHTTPEVLLVTLDIASNATDGVSVGVGIPDTASLGVGPFDMVNLTAPAESGLATVARGSVVLVQSTDLAPVTVNSGSGSPFLQLHLTSSSGVLALNNLTLTLTGTVTDGDIQFMALHNDLNGDGRVDGAEPVVGKETVPSGGMAVFSNLGFTVIPDTGSDLLVTVTLSESVASGTTVGIALDDETDLEMLGDVWIDPVGFPFNSSQSSVISVVWQHLNVTHTDLAPYNVSAGESRIPMLLVHLEPDTSMLLEGMKLNVLGSGADGITGIALWRDLDNDGWVDSGDGSLGNVVPDSGYVEYTGLGLLLNPGTAYNLLFTVDLAPNANDSTVFHLELDKYHIHMASGKVMMSGNFPIRSSNTTIGAVSDDLGPVVKMAGATPNPMNGVLEVTITATISDATTGRSVISTAELWVGDTEPSGGQGTSMTPVDGTFDHMVEEVELKLDVLESGWAVATTYQVHVRARDALGNWGLASTVSVDTGSDMAPPEFDGLGSVDDPGTGTSLNLSWEEARDMSGPVIYHVFRSTEDGFTPDDDTLVTTTGSDLTQYVDTGLEEGTTYYYMVRAEDALGFADDNTKTVAGTPTSGNAVVDSDDDGMPDEWEEQNGLDSNDPADAQADSDDDGLSNLEEFLAGIDPNDEDTDGDGMPDGWEVDNNLSPTDDSDDGLDDDGDGFTNLEEYQSGTDPQDVTDVPDEGDSDDADDAGDDSGGDGDSSDDESGDEEGGNLWWIILVIILLIIILILVMIIIRGKKDGSDELEDELEDELTDGDEMDVPPSTPMSAPSISPLDRDPTSKTVPPTAMPSPQTTSPAGPEHAARPPDHGEDAHDDDPDIDNEDDIFFMDSEDISWEISEEVEPSVPMEDGEPPVSQPPVPEGSDAPPGDDLPPLPDSPELDGGPGGDTPPPPAGGSAEPIILPAPSGPAAKPPASAPDQTSPSQTAAKAPRKKKKKKVKKKKARTV